MATISPEVVLPIPNYLLDMQISSGGLVPGYGGPELWDCTDERPLVPFQALRRTLEFGKDSASFAVAGAREGFALIDLVARAALEGSQSLERYKTFLEQKETRSPYLYHSVGMAQRAQYGSGELYPDIEARFDLLYAYFRKMEGFERASTEDMQHQSSGLLQLMRDYGAAILNSHSDTAHEKDAGKITLNQNPLVGCAHNKLVGLISEDAAKEELLPAANRVGNLIGFDELPLETAARGLSIVAKAFNVKGPYEVRRDALVEEHRRRHKPADIVLDGDHLLPSHTSLIVDGARTARNISAQNKASINTFMSNPVMVAERMKKLSEFGQNTQLIIAITVLHMLAVRNRLCGEESRDNPSILPVYVTPFRFDVSAA